MWTFVVRRILYMIPLLLAVSFLGFMVISIQPGNVLSGCELSASKEYCNQQRRALGLDKPWPVQYYIWIRNIVCCTEQVDLSDPGHPKPWVVWSIDSQFPFIHYRPDWGWSSRFKQPVSEFLFGQGGKALRYSIILILTTTLFVWLIAIPIGIYSATHKYSLADHSFTFLGFVGLSIPDFLLALLYLELMVGILRVGSWCGPIVQFFHAGAQCGLGVGNLFDPDYFFRQWDWAKFRNFLWHLWPLVLIVGGVNMAQIMRYMRSNLLDVLGRPYVHTARAKGLSERTVIYKHAARNAINPLITMLGYWMPAMIESMLVAAAVLNADIVERNFWLALQDIDKPVIVAGLLFFAVILLMGNLIADILLVLSDPRIRYE